MNTITIACVAAAPSSGDTNYIGLRPYIYILLGYNSIPMGHVRINLRGISVGGWLCGIKQTGMLQAAWLLINPSGLFCVADVNYTNYTHKNTSDNNIYRKFIIIHKEIALPYPTPPKEISAIGQLPHTGWGSIKMGRYLIPRGLNKNDSQRGFEGKVGLVLITVLIFVIWGACL